MCVCVCVDECVLREELFVLTVEFVLLVLVFAFVCTLLVVVETPPPVMVP